MGHFIATLIVAAGIGTLIAGNSLLLLILTIAGALYLLWIGVNLFIHSASISISNEQVSSTTKTKSWLIKGICVSGLNPKVFLFFLALLPQFIDQNSEWSVAMQIITLGLIHIFSCGIVYLIVGFSAYKLLGTRPKAAQVVTRVSGALMILISTILLLEQI